MLSFKYLFTFCGLLALSISGSSQILNESFSTGTPVNWGQSPVSSWSLNTSLGFSGGNCVITENIDSMADTAVINTPTLNLSGFTNITVTFNTALTKNNFIIPNMALYYDAGEGLKFLARWGSGFSPSTTYTVNDMADYVPPLDAQYVSWETCSVTVPTSATNTAVSIIFRAELFNGGYVLLDNVTVSGTPITNTGLKENLLSSVKIFPNPASDKLLLEGQPVKNFYLINSLGQNISVPYKAVENATEIDLEALPSAAYYLKVFLEDGSTATKKIMIH